MAKKKTKSATRSRTTARRKTARKKRSTASSKALRLGTADAVSVSHFLNPFSSANVQPKIPDGKVNTSIGQTLTIVREHFNVGPSNMMHGLLFPGMGGGFMMLDCQEFNGTQISSPKYSTDAAFSYTTENGMQVLQAKEEYHSWRIVSQGVNFQLINPAEQDDGWYECCRLTDITSLFDYEIRQHDNTPFRGRSCFLPYWLCGNIAQSNIADEPTYETGLLKNIHKKNFNLHQVKDDVDFTQVCSPTSIEGGVEVGDGLMAGTPFVVALGAGGTNPGEAYGMQNYNAIRNFNDFSYDAIYFRFHCRDAATPTRLLTHVKCNQEIQYSHESGLSRFQTQTKRIKEIPYLMDKRNGGADTTSVPSSGNHPGR